MTDSLSIALLAATTLIILFLLVFIIILVLNKGLDKLPLLGKVIGRKGKLMYLRVLRKINQAKIAKKK